MSAKTTKTEGPQPPEPEPDDHRARQCLDGLWYALLTRHGTDYLDLLLLDAKAWAQPMEVGSKRYELAQDYAERLHRGR